MTETTGIQETLTRKPGIIVLYGMHGINEEIAARAVERLKTSSITRRTEPEFKRWNTGMDYVDAFEWARRESPDNNDTLLEKYKRRFKSSAIEASRRRVEIATQNNNKLVIDVHATPANIDQSEFVEQGLILDVGDPSLVLGLKSELNKVLLHSADGNPRFFIEVRPLTLKDGTVTDFALLERIHPKNLVVLEIIGNYDVYDCVEGGGVGSLWDNKTKAGLHRLKDVSRIANQEQRLELMGRISRETNRYCRLLEVVLPVIARFYQEKGIVS